VSHVLEIKIIGGHVRHGRGGDAKKTAALTTA